MYRRMIGSIQNKNSFARSTEPGTVRIKFRRIKVTTHRLGLGVGAPMHFDTSGEQLYHLYFRIPFL